MSLNNRFLVFFKSSLITYFFSLIFLKNLLINFFGSIFFKNWLINYFSIRFFQKKITLLEGVSAKGWEIPLTNQFFSVRLFQKFTNQLFFNSIFPQKLLINSFFGSIFFKNLLINFFWFIPWYTDFWYRLNGLFLSFCWHTLQYWALEHILEPIFTLEGH